MTANLYDILAAGAPADTTRPAFIHAGSTLLDYAALADAVARTAGLLADAEAVAPGDRVLAVAGKTVATVILYLATLRAGGVFVPVNPACTESELAHFITDASPRLIVRDPAALVARAQGPDIVPLKQSMARAADDLAAIIYTSGTTGRPKGAMLSHGNLAANARALVHLWNFGPDDRLIHALPVFHVHGLFVALHCALLAGAAVLWLDKFDDDAIIRLLPQATVLMGVPTFYTRLLANPAFTRDISAGMRLFISGSAPLLETTFAAFEARTGQRILERYGMSEAVIITSNPLDGDRIAGSVGYPLPGVELRIAGVTGDGEPGVIQIRGPSVFSGYWQMPGRTAEEFTADGWFITGDIGRKDADGRVWISGRAKDLIISGGYNVYPKEVELLIDTLDGVTESAVIGVPHPDLGEAVVAVVEGDADEAALIAAARKGLAPYKLPRRVSHRDALPRNTMGKVQKNLLRAELAGLFTPD